MSEFHDNSIVELLTTIARLHKFIHHADIVHPKRKAWITEVLETIDLLKQEFDFPEIYDALETIRVSPTEACYYDVQFLKRCHLTTFNFYCEPTVKTGPEEEEWW